MDVAFGVAVVDRSSFLNSLLPIIVGYSDENRRLLHSRNDTESIDTEQV